MTRTTTTTPASPASSASSWPSSRLSRLSSRLSADSVGAAPPSLAPAPHPVGVFPEHAQHTAALALTVCRRRPARGGLELTIEDALSGACAFRAAAPGRKARTELSDSRGRVLCTLARRPLRVRTTFDARAPRTGELLFTIRAALGRGGTRLTVTYRNPAIGCGETLQLRVDARARSVEITLGTGGPALAQISRGFIGTGDAALGTRAYELAVAPNVDTALMAAICICLDEKSNGD